MIAAKKDKKEGLPLKSNDLEVEESKRLLENVLPFYYNEDDPVLNLSVEELLQNGHTKTKYHKDGFIGFHHLKFVTSNPKQMSKLFEMTMGFQEIAYRGLENGSRYLASHVVKNGGVIIEFIGTLQTFVENPSSVPIHGNELNEVSWSSVYKLIDTNSLILDLFNKLRDKAFDTNMITSSQIREYLSTKLEDSAQFSSFSYEMEKILSGFYQHTDSSIQDMIMSYLISNYLTHHGEGVIDVAFLVNDVDKAFHRAVKMGALVIRSPVIQVDMDGEISIATVGIPNTDIHHTLIAERGYNGAFMPGYTKSESRLNPSLEKVSFYELDHCVENYSWNQMMDQAFFYAAVFGFHKFWSVDDTEIATENSSLNSFVVASSNGKIKIPINEPSKGKMKGQIEEFNDFNGGPGVQHIALKTFDIIKTVKAMKQNGIQFNNVGPKYYSNLRMRLKEDDIVLKEDFETLRELNILVDYDASSRNPKTRLCDYLLQIFTNPLNDRPTIFIEVIQRHHHNGFGKGTFKGLYESIELEQRKRGNLVPSKH